VIVKICGITNRGDAVAAVEAGATAIGFNFYRESQRYISPTGAATIGEKLNVTKVGVFVNESAANVARVALEANLDVAQLHGASEALGIRIWRARRADEIRFVNVDDIIRKALEALDVAELPAPSQGSGLRSAFLSDDPKDELAEAVLLDAPSKTLYGGTGESFDWSVARGLLQQIILAGGLDADNVASAIQQAKPWGVDACSRLESSPGLKDHEKMRQFVKAALAAAASLNL